jgi:hypothetical protein
MKRGDRRTGIRVGLASFEGVLRCRVVVALVVAGVCGVLLVGAVPVAGAAVVGHRPV